MSMFRSIRKKCQKQKYGRRDLAGSLEIIEKRQAEIAAMTTSLIPAQTATLEALKAILDDRRPSWIAWVQAVLLLVVSAGIAFYAAVETVNESSVSYIVTSMHQNAQSERTEAFEGAVVYLANPSRKQSDMPSVLNSALKQLRSADTTDAKADGLENGLGSEQLRTQIFLGAGSAFFGAVVAWILTQLLSALRWSRKVEPKSTRAAR